MRRFTAYRGSNVIILKRCSWFSRRMYDYILLQISIRLWSWYWIKTLVKSVRSCHTLCLRMTGIAGSFNECVSTFVVNQLSPPPWPQPTHNLTLLSAVKERIMVTNATGSQLNNCWRTSWTWSITWEWSRYKKADLKSGIVEINTWRNDMWTHTFRYTYILRRVYRDLFVYYRNTFLCGVSLFDWSKEKTV